MYNYGIHGLAAHFKREFVVSYFEKHGIMPKIYDRIPMNPRVRRLFEEGKPASIREYFRILKEAWTDLEFDKKFEFNYFPQISVLLDDKAITPHLCHIYHLFAEDALMVIGKHKLQSTVNTKLILEILARDVIDIKEFYDIVEKYGVIPLN